MDDSIFLLAAPILVYLYLALDRRFLTCLYVRDRRQKPAGMTARFSYGYLLRYGLMLLLLLLAILYGFRTAGGGSGSSEGDNGLPPPKPYTTTYLKLDTTTSAQPQICACHLDMITDADGVLHHIQSTETEGENGQNCEHLSDHWRPLKVVHNCLSCDQIHYVDGSNTTQIPYGPGKQKYHCNIVN